MSGVDIFGPGRHSPPVPKLFRRPARLAAIAFALCVTALALAPLLSLVGIAAQGDAEIWPHLIAYVLPTALAETALLLAGVAVITTAVGVGTAYCVTAFRFPGRDILIWLLPMPLAIPTYIVAYVYVDLLDAWGPVQSVLRAIFGWRSAADYWFPNIRSVGGAAFVMGFVLYPYVYLAARAMFQTQDWGLAEAARLLGASPLALARDITLPLARPAIAAGLSLALLETLNDIGASEYLGVRTLTLSVFTTWLNRGSLPGAAQIACVMLLVVAGLIALERYGRGARRFAHTDTTQRARPIALGGAKAWAAALVCCLPVVLGFILPFGYLAQETLTRGLLIGSDPQLIRHTINTVIFAGAAAFLTLVLGFSLVIVWRLTKERLVAAGMFAGSFGYAMPGTVLALGLLSPIVLVDEGLNVLAQATLHKPVGLVIVGSGAALVIAYVARFLAIAIGFAQAGFARIATELDDMARVVGARPRQVIGLVHAPLMRHALAGAALLVFIDCLKELPATLLLRPLNVETLSTYIYQFATRGSFEDGALAALIIVMVGVLPVIRTVRYADAALYPQDEPAPA